MDLSRIPLFAMMTKRMAWLDQRQEILAENLANADTPQYKPRDLAPADFRGLIAAGEARLKARRTDASHLGLGSREGEFRPVEQQDSYEATLSGNAVVVEEQMMKVVETAVHHQTVTKLYRAHINMLKTALGRGAA